MRVNQASRHTNTRAYHTNARGKPFVAVGAKLIKLECHRGKMLAKHRLQMFLPKNKISTSFWLQTGVFTASPNRALMISHATMAKFHLKQGIQKQVGFNHVSGIKMPDSCYLRNF